MISTLELMIERNNEILSDKLEKIIIWHMIIQRELNSLVLSGL